MTEDDREREYKCRGCGERNTIVQMSLVPRAFGVIPGEGGIEPELDVMSDRDEAYWEGESVLAYACSNGDCRYFEGSVGLNHVEGVGWKVKEGWSINTVARVVLAR